MKINRKPNKKWNLKTFFLLLLSFFFSLMSFAQTLPSTLEGVTLSPQLTLKEGPLLHLVGAGLRNKKVLMLNVRVYVGEFFVADPAKFKKTPSEALKSLPEAAPAMIRLHFLREVDAEKVQASFKEALEANKIDLKKPEVQKFLEAVRTGGEAKKGKSLSVLGVKKSDGSEAITYESSNSKAITVSGGPGFIQDIFSIWLGQPSDEGVEKLKAEILK
ncbi:MAG: chalcone isomerase family protein [Pseudobdellovibrionaceae bacterium]